MAGYYFQQQVAYSQNGVPLDTTGDLFSPHADATQVAMRIYGLPWYEDNGEKLLHIGIGYSREFRSNAAEPTGTAALNNPGTLDFKSSPEANLFSPLVDTGSFLAQNVNIIDPEIAMVWGPFSLQSEYIWVSANDVTGALTGTPLSATDHDANFSGWYAQASYFLTGEHRRYALTASPATYQATFGRVIPNCNFNPVSGGWGAWELAIRASQLDCNDINAGFNGGLETDYTVAVNWYLNPNVMVKMDYVHALVDVRGDATSNAYGIMTQNGVDNIYEMRFQIAF
jgi:phosphate-selective porin OprO/OprP